MSELHTIPTYPVREIKGMRVEDVLLPMETTMLEALLQNCPVVVSVPLPHGEQFIQFTPPPVISISGYDIGDFSLRQPSSYHQRSSVLDFDGFQPMTDGHGNRYKAVTLKGANFSKPGIAENPASSDGVVAWGLQESKIIERVLRASHELVERGIGTERIIGLAEPVLYPWPTIDKYTEAYEMVSLSDYKQRIIQKRWQELPDDQRTVEAYTDLVLKFDAMTFYISMRFTDTEYRLGDTSISTEALKEVYDDINTHYLLEGEQPYDAMQQDDYARYVCNFFAPRAAKNLARLHSDLAHGFLHRFNWTALGSIVDLDSVHGLGLGMGDEPITPKNRLDDIIETCASMIQSIHERIKSTQFDPAKIAVEAFADNYFNEMRQNAASEDDISADLRATIFARDYFSFEGADILDTIRRRFFDAFYNQPYQDQLLESDRTVYKLIRAADQNDGLLKRVLGALRDGYDEYAYYVMLYEINRTDDRHEWIFDHDIIAIIHEQIIEEIKKWLNEQLLLADESPKWIRDVEDEQHKRMIIEQYIMKFRSTINEMAMRVLGHLMPTITEQVFEQCALSLEEEPDSILPNHKSCTNLGPQHNTIWLGTEYVDLSIIEDILRKFDGTIAYKNLDDLVYNSYYRLPIAQSEGVTEVISNSGYGAGLFEEDEDGNTTIYVEYNADNECIVVVSRNGEDVNLTVYRETPIIVDQALQPQEVQDYLF